MDVATLMVRVGGDTSDAEAKLAGLSGKIDGFAGKAGRSGAAMSAAFTAPIVAAGAVVFGLGSSFESAFTGVVKTVDAPRAVIQSLRQDILDMSRDIPVGANAIADVMAAGGQLGIATENLTGFTRTMLDLGEATNLTSIQAAQDLARFANITQMPQEQFGNLGSSVVALGNNMATTEADIVGFSMRLAGAGRQVGMSEADILGIAAAYSSVGVEAEAGGTAASRVLIEMATAAATNSAELEGFAQTAGMSVNEFERLFEEDAAGALVAFTEGLGRMSREGENVFGVLEDLGLGEIRVRDALLRSAGAGDLMRRALTLSNEAWAENNALTKEAETRYATVGSQVGKIINRLRLTGITLYDNVRPQLEDTLGSVAGFADGLVGMAEALGRVDPSVISAVLAFGAVLAAAGPAALAVAGLAKAAALLATPFGLAAVAVGLSAAGFAALKTAAGDNPILSPATIKAVEDWPAPLASLATWAIGAGAAVGFLWNAFKQPEDVDPDGMTQLLDAFRMAFGENAAGKLTEAAGAVSAFGDAVKKTQEALVTIDSAVSIDGWFSDAAIAAIGMLPTQLAGVALTLLGIGAGMAVLKQAMTGWQDAEKGMAALRTFNTIFGPEATTNLSAAATHVSALAAGITTLVTAGDAQPLADALTGIGTALNNLATDKIAELKTALGGLTTLGLSLDSDTGKLKLDLSQTVQGVRDAFDAAFAGEDAGLVDLTVVTTWLDARKRDVVEAFTAAFGAGDANLVGAAGAGSAAGPVTAWVTARKHEVTQSLRAAFVGEDATLFDATIVSGWVTTQLTGIQEELRKQFSGDTALGRMGNTLVGGILGISTLLEGFSGKTGAEQFSAAVGIVSTALGTLGALKTEALTTAMDAVTGVFTGVSGAATDFVANTDVSKVTGFITALLDEIAAGLTVALDDTRMASIGAAAGDLVGAIVTKFGEVLGSDGFGTDVGTAVGNATGAMLNGAVALVDGFAGALDDADWGKVATQVQGFADTFVDAFVAALKTSMATYAERTVTAGLNTPGTGMPAVSEGSGAVGGWLGDVFSLLPDKFLDAMGLSPDAIYAATGLKAVGDQATATADSMQGSILAQGEYTAAVERQAQEQKPGFWGQLWENLWPKGPSGGLGTNIFGVQPPPDQEPVSVPAVYDFSRVDQMLETLAPIPVPAQPDFTRAGETAAAIEPVTVPARPDFTDWSGSGLIPLEPINVPAVVTEVTPAPGLTMDWALPGFRGMADAAPDTSGIQSAVDQLNAFAFSWPEYPAWEWPPITIPDWPDVPTPPWVWKAIPSPSWLGRLTVPRPNWLGELLTWSPTVTVTGGGAPALAEGTPRWGGGLALVGERGPELVSLPRGAAVYPTAATEAMLAGAGGVNVTIHATVANDLDMEVLAQRVADAIRRRGR